VFYPEFLAVWQESQYLLGHLVLSCFVQCKMRVCERDNKDLTVRTLTSIHSSITHTHQLKIKQNSYSDCQALHKLSTFERPTEPRTLFVVGKQHANRYAVFSQYLFCFPQAFRFTLLELLRRHQSRRAVYLDF
jgi:hypothetical protein